MFSDERRRRNPVGVNNEAGQKSNDEWLVYEAFGVSSQHDYSN